MTAPGLAYARYRAGDRDEWWMRIGDEGAPTLLFLPPLFEELNRTRAFLAATMRALAAEGWCCRLPDLPGTGESERALEEVSWEDWRQAVRAAAAAAGDVAATVAVRGGALLDEGLAAFAWRFAPATGASLARDLSRAGLMNEGGGGYQPSATLQAELSATEPAHLAQVRTVRLATDRAEADLKLEGPPLWRRAEPQTAPELSATIASDIFSWVRQCAAS